MKQVIEMVLLDLKNSEHKEFIPQLMEWTGKPGEVLLLDERRLATHHHGFAAVTAENILAGYIAITMEHLSPYVWQLGGFIVNPDMEGKGIGTRMTSYLLENIPDLMPEAEIVLARVNKKSVRIFKKLGANAVQRDAKAVRRNAKAARDLTVYWYFENGVLVPAVNNF